MSRSKPETSGSVLHPGDGAVAFAAPGDTSGTAQRAMRGHIIVLPGGVLLVDEALSEPLRAALGREVSGPIECKNGR
jgi:hypothetical protein